MKVIEGKLPKGITAALTDGVLVYRVRFMMDGARINLGTFTSLIKANQAMMEFKQKDMLKHHMHLSSNTYQPKPVNAMEEVIADSFTHEQTAHWYSLLANENMNDWLPGKDAVVTDNSNPDGYTVIPAIVVDAYREQQTTSDKPNS